jgi:hypothetical protein
VIRAQQRRRCVFRARRGTGPAIEALFDASFDFGCPALVSTARRSRRGDDVVNVLVERERRKRMETPSKSGVSAAYVQSGKLLLG